MDENVPDAILADFVGHDCDHVIRLGWAGIKNGDLLTMAEAAEFEVLITLDKGIPSQQKLSDRGISVVVVRPSGQGVQATKAMMPQILQALLKVQKGETIILTNRNSTHGL